MSVLPRRDVLKSGLLLAGAGGWTILNPHRVFGTAAHARIKLGIVGCGGRGHWIARLFAEHGGYEIHAVADYFREVADACGDEFDVPANRRFSGLEGYRGLMESGVEAVALETPPYCFPDHTEAAVAAGLHVFLAKPVAVDVPGTMKVAELGEQSRRAGKCFLVDYQIPTDPFNREVVARIHAGAIGTLAMVTTCYLAGRFNDPPLGETIADRLRNLVWVNDVDLGGGYHVNACIHAIEAGLWIARRRPTAAVGASRIGRPDPHGDSRDQFSLTFEFEDGLVMNHVGTHLNAPFHVRGVAYGQKGNAEIGYVGDAFVRGGDDPYEGGEVADLYAAGARRNIATFHESVQAGDASNPTIEPAIDSTLATILGREVGRRRERLTMETLLAENKRIEPDLSGLER